MHSPLTFVTLMLASMWGGYALGEFEAKLEDLITGLIVISCFVVALVLLKGLGVPLP
jgi:ABC-type glycerol-3-phosphate transport system permease component